MRGPPQARALARRAGQLHEVTPTADSNATADMGHLKGGQPEYLHIRGASLQFHFRWLA